MSCSSGSELIAGVSSSMRYRTCVRTACDPSIRETKCCDDNCLVEIARRECKTYQRLHEKAPNSALDVPSIPSPDDGEPCESHYLKAKTAYSEILNNIGCICKVLLSLNLESCCRTPPAGSLPHKRSTTSQTEGLMAELRHASSDRSSSKSLKSVGCSKSSCCADGPSEITATEPAKLDEYLPSSRTTEIFEAVTTELTITDDGCNMKGCCGAALLTPTNSPVSPAVAKQDIDCHGAPCSTVSADFKPNITAYPATCETSGKCCVELGHVPKSSVYCKDTASGCESNDISSIFSTRNIEASPSEGYCSEVKPESISGCQPIIYQQPLSTICCSSDPTGGNPSTLGICQSTGGGFGCQERRLNSNCAGSTEMGCCSSENGGDKCLQNIRISPYIPIISVERIDVEKGSLQPEHVIASVQGMTCTGCEKALHKALISIPTISNIKTSLILGQMEFDYGPSANIDVVEIIKAIEKMTGFNCTIMTQSGHHLDLTIEGLTSDFIDGDWPLGVSDITPLNTSIVRVTYHPRLVGARDLMNDPFFESAKLAPMADRPLITSGRAHLRSMLFKTFVSTLLTIPVLVLAWAQLPPHEIYYGAASLVLATIVQVYIAGPWYLSAFKALFFSHLIEMDLLVVLSTTTAYVYSIVAYAFLASSKPLSTGSFFETSTLLVTLIMVGRLVTGFARQRAVESISVESLQPTTAILEDGKSQDREEIDTRLLQYGDIFVALPDTSIATDGTVIAGISEVDESMITGEATLVPKSPGSAIIAGSINQSGTLIIRLSRLPGDNTIKVISIMVDDAKSTKAKIQGLADRMATYFIPTILAITVVVFVVWAAVGKAIRGYDTTRTCINAMTYAISALIVSCPCAIGLAVPMVLVISGGVAAKHGLIFKAAETIEIARNISHVIFDKTGTLTQGLLAVETELYPTAEGPSLAPMLLGLTSNNKHPVSFAVASHLTSSGVQADRLDNIKLVPGCGIEATWGEEIVRAGNPYWLGVENLPAVKKILSLGVIVFCVTVNNGLVAVYGLKDSLRPDTRAVINELKRRHIEVSIVSGDNEESVRHTARSLGVPESHVRFRCSPADKQIYVKQISSGQGVAMFCGDGTNDAIALASASIGMHMSGGTDIAQSAADAVLIRPALSGVITLIDLSKAFYCRIVFNFAWSFVYNTFAILLAAGAFPNARIPPQFAGLGEIVSVLPVIAIGMQLKWAKFSNFGA